MKAAFGFNPIDENAENAFNSEKYINKQQFLIACSNVSVYNKLSKILSPQLRRRGVIPDNDENEQKKYNANQFFDFLDVEDDGILNLVSLRRLIALEADGSKIRYILDTLALSTSSVTGTAFTISRGLHPIVCIIGSVTMCSVSPIVNVAIIIIIIIIIITMSLTLTNKISGGDSKGFNL